MKKKIAILLLIFLVINAYACGEVSVPVSFVKKNAPNAVYRTSFWQSAANLFREDRCYISCKEYKQIISGIAENLFKDYLKNKNNMRLSYHYYVKFSNFTDSINKETDDRISTGYLDNISSKYAKKIRTESVNYELNSKEKDQELLNSGKPVLDYRLPSLNSIFGNLSLLCFYHLLHL